MHTITGSIEIAAPLATLRTAITTRDGFRGWMADDTEVDAGGRYTFRFARPEATRAVTFRIDRADDHGVAMTCVHDENNPDWNGTRLTISLTPLAGGRARVDLEHAGYASKSETYERSAQAWTHFLSSLAKYATTGKGEPFSARATSGSASPARVLIGNHAAVVVARSEQERIRRFYCGVLGARAVVMNEEVDRLQLGDLHLCFVYQTGALDPTGFSKAIWLELQTDDVEQARRDILAFGVTKLDVPDPHLYFQAPGGQVFRLVGIGEDLSVYEQSTSTRPRSR